MLEATQEACFKLQRKLCPWFTVDITWGCSTQTHNATSAHAWSPPLNEKRLTGPISDGPVAEANLPLESAVAQNVYPCTQSDCPLHERPFLSSCPNLPNFFLV